MWSGVLETELVYEEDSDSVVWDRALVLESVDEGNASVV